MDKETFIFWAIVVSILCPAAPLAIGGVLLIIHLIGGVTYLAAPKRKETPPCTK